MSVIKEMKKMIKQVKESTEKGFIVYDEGYENNNIIIDLMNESYSEFKLEFKKLQKLLSFYYDYEIESYDWSLERIVNSNQSNYKLNESDREKIEKYDENIIDNLEDLYKTIEQAYNDFYGEFVFFKIGDDDYCEFLDDCIDVYENNDYINVHRKTRYQNIKDILNFNDITEILDYCFENCNDEVNIKVDEFLESDDYKNNNEYKLSIECILNEMFLDNYDIEIIYNE